jgi:cobalamin biosynthesis protein CbiD
MEPLFKLNNVYFAYPDSSPILRGISLTIENGQIAVLMGKNACGKTTLLHHLNGCLKPQHGEVFLRGRSISAILPKKVRKMVGLLMQDPKDQLHATSVYEYVASGPIGLGMAKKVFPKKVKFALEKVKMWEMQEKSLYQLSFGQQKQVAFAKILAMEPKVLVLDDPTAGLDQKTISNFLAILKDLQNHGHTIILATHDIDLVPTFASKVIILAEGKVLAEGKPAEVFVQEGLMRSAGLRLPRIAHLFEILKNKEGWATDSYPLSIGEARKALTGYRYFNGKTWRKGYSTGACAAAAAKAAVKCLIDKKAPKNVEVLLPAGKIWKAPLAKHEINHDSASCCVIKDAGDDPDVTNGLEVWARAEWSNQGIIILGGEGIGIATQPGVGLDIGKPAINKVPMEMIRQEVKHILSESHQGVKITISVPEGAKIANRTLNPMLGIVGGISILGTTGIVEPMSEEAFKSSLVPQITKAQAQGFTTVVLVPGRIGYKQALKFGFLPEQVLMTSNFIGFMLEECVRLGIKGVIILGHIGKLIKIAGGIFQTHSKLADARREIFAACCLEIGADTSIIHAAIKCVTVEEAANLFINQNPELFTHIAQRISKRAMFYIKEELAVGTIVTTLEGNILGYDLQAVNARGEICWPK